MINCLIRAFWLDLIENIELTIVKLKTYFDDKFYVNYLKQFQTICFLFLLIILISRLLKYILLIIINTVFF